MNGNVIDSSSHSMTVLQNQLTAQQSEITQLRNERHEMLNRIKGLENHPNLLKSPLDQNTRSNKPLDQSSLKDALGQVEGRNALNLPLEISKLRDQFEQLKALQSKTHGGIGAPMNHTPTAKGTEENMSNLEKDVKSLKIWKETQTGPTAKDQVKDLIKETKKLIDINQSVLDSTDKQGQQMNDIRKGQDILKDDVDRLQRREAKTYAKAAETEQQLEEHKMETRKFMDEARNDTDILFDKFSKYVGPVREEYETRGQTVLERLEKTTNLVGQAKSFQGEQLRLSAEYKKLVLRTDQFVRRIEVLEKDQDCPTTSGFKKVGTPAQSSIDKAFQETTENQLSQLTERVNNAEIVLKKHEVLAKDVEDVKKQIPDHNSTRLSMHEAFEKKLDESENRVSKRCEEMATNMGGLSDRVSTLELNSSNSGPGATHSIDVLDSSSNTRMQRIEAEISSLHQNIEQVDNSLRETEQTVHGHANLIEGLEETVPALFKEKFDGLKTTLEEQVATFEDFRNQMILKADINAVKIQFDKYHAIIKNLTDRYDNLTTDTIYQKMAQWFVQTYPNPAANMMNQLPVIQHEVSTLRKDYAKFLPMMNQFLWIQARYSDLVQLLNNGPQLQALVDGTAEMQQQPQTVAKVEEACANARAAVSKSEEAMWKVEQFATKTTELKESLDGVQTSCYKLNTNMSSHAKAEDLNALRLHLSGFQSHVQENMNSIHADRVTLRNEFVAAATNESEIRVKTEEQLRNSVDEVKKTIESLQSFVASHSELSMTVNKLDGSNIQLRKDFDTVNDTYIQPNKHIFGMLNAVIVVSKDLQHWVESINQNIDHPLVIKWEFDMNAQSNEPANGPLNTK